MKLNLIIPIFFFLAFGAYPQQKNEYDFKQFFDEGGKLVKRPIKWNLGDWFILTGISAGAYGVSFLDQDLRKFSLDNNEYKYSIPIEFGRYWGEQVPNLFLSVGFLAHGILTDNRANRKLGFELLQSHFYTVAVTGALKISFGRARPRIESQNNLFHPFSFRGDDYMAFPSGHTSTAFSLSTVLDSHIENDFLSGLIYVPAFLTAISRVYQNHHWVSDVFFGAFIGYFVGNYLTDLHEKNEEYFNAVQPTGETVNFIIAF